jgi:hypothetical protein
VAAYSTSSNTQMESLLELDGVLLELGTIPLNFLVMQGESFPLM